MVQQKSKWGLSSILFCLTLFLQSSLALAEVTASTGRTVLSIDETVVLEIKSENNSGDPDLSHLKDDFQIMGRSQSQNFSLINGTASRTHTWNITLLPKRTGELTIPAIKVGNETTKSIHLVIQKQSKTPAVDGKEVFLKIAIGNVINKKTEDTVKQQEDYYVQQQIIVTVKLFHRIRFSNATLSELELDNTVIEKLGNDANYSKVISNHRYNIIERRYAIYPQQSGSLTIPAMTFSGNAEITQNFSLFSKPGRQIISRTKPITLNIKAIPESYTGQFWLPAESLEIESSIIEDSASITKGEAITRNIIVRAQGLLGSQLPVTQVASSKNIKTYPDKEKLSNQLINGKVLGIRHDTVAIIPLKSGDFTLPEIKIDWWNTQTNQQETALLPAKTFYAAANSDTPDVASPVTADTSQKTNSNGSTYPIDTPQDGISNTSEQDKSVIKTVEKIINKEIPLTKNIWFWISMALLVIWLMTLALLIVVSTNKKQSSKADLKKSNTSTKKHKNYLQTVYNACLENDANKAVKSLIQWAKFYYKQPLLSGLSAIIDLIDDEHLCNAINNLESCQYSHDKKDWNGEALSSALTHYIKKSKEQGKNKDKKEKAFSNLNP